MEHAEPTEQPWHQDRWLLGLILVAALLGLIYNYAILIGFGPDEPRHMAYVKLLLHEHVLPYQEAGGVEHAGAHTFHPPLYYLIVLPFYAAAQILPESMSWHVARLVSLTLCLATLPLIYQIALRAAAGERVVARLAVAQVALLPLFGMTASTINNDSAAFLAVTVFLWLLAVKYPAERSLKSALWLGVCLGLGTLCKATALLCDGVALLLYLWLQDGRATFAQARTWIRLGVVVGLTLLIAGWWHLRSFHLYGTFTPLPPPMPPPLPSAQNGLLVVLLHPNFSPLLLLANGGIFYTAGHFITLSGYGVTVPAGIWFTMWSQIDWIPESWRVPLASVLLLYSAVAVAGHVARWRGRNISALPPTPEAATMDVQDAGYINALSQRIAIWTTYAAFMVTWLTVLQVAIFMHWGWAEGGRYLVPVLSGTGIFLALGWRGILGAARLHGLTLAWSVCFIALNAVTIYRLLTYLNPKYGPKG